MFVFIGGFALLPFLWCVNSVWFFKEAFLKESYEQQNQIKTCKYMYQYFEFFKLVSYIFKFKSNRIEPNVVFLSSSCPCGEGRGLSLWYRPFRLIRTYFQTFISKLFPRSAPFFMGRIIWSTVTCSTISNSWGFCELCKFFFKLILIRYVYIF